MKSKYSVRARSRFYRATNGERYVEKCLKLSRYEFAASSMTLFLYPQVG